MSLEPNDDDRRKGAACASGCMTFIVLAVLTATFIAWSAFVGVS